ncbi:Uncharacterised protein [Klebsiella pneumoniae]|nr:Uncharacterised protein [Klebsiella pneumoniae]VGI93366.1 Uncharacterised protein [Klebsiella pneumoniae]
MCAEINATNALPGLIGLHINNIISGTPQAHIPQARQAQRRRAGHLRRHTCLCAGWRLRLIRPTGGSRKPLYRRPGKRSAAGQDTSGAIPAFVPDGGFALSGLREDPVSPYTVGPASAAPPGRTPQTPYPFLCRMALRLSGLRHPPVRSYTPGPASAAPPGRTPPVPFPPLCRMAAAPYPAYGILPQAYTAPPSNKRQAAYLTPSAWPRTPGCCSAPAKPPASGPDTGKQPASGSHPPALHALQSRHR